MPPQTQLPGGARQKPIGPPQGGTPLPPPSSGMLQAGRPFGPPGAVGHPQGYSQGYSTQGQTGFGGANHTFQYGAPRPPSGGFGSGQGYGGGTSHPFTPPPYGMPTGDGGNYHPAVQPGGTGGWTPLGGALQGGGAIPPIPQGSWGGPGGFQMPQQLPQGGWRAGRGNSEPFHTPTGHGPGDGTSDSGIPLNQLRGFPAQSPPTPWSPWSMMARQQTGWGG